MVTLFRKSNTGKGIIRGGINVKYIGTLTSTTRRGGVFYSEGKAIIYANDGEIATHTTQGIGNCGSSGKIQNHNMSYEHLVVPPLVVVVVLPRNTLLIKQN
ncbi:MAG: hypothetical protein M3044_04900 [Thermoproteota archaeon]|nr:hypothetical protein [Thermoproteota archaeon]